MFRVILAKSFAGSFVCWWAGAGRMKREWELTRADKGPPARRDYREHTVGFLPYSFSLPRIIYSRKSKSYKVVRVMTAARRGSRPVSYEAGYTAPLQLLVAIDGFVPAILVQCLWEMLIAKSDRGY